MFMLPFTNRAFITSVRLSGCRSSVLSFSTKKPTDNNKGPVKRRGRRSNPSIAEKLNEIDRNSADLRRNINSQEKTYLRSSITGDNEHRPVRQSIKVAKNVSVLEKLLENSDNHEASVFGQIMTKGLQLKNPTFTKKVFDDYLIGDERNHCHINKIHFSCLFMALTGLRCSPETLDYYIRLLWKFDITPDEVTLTNILSAGMKFVPFKQLLDIWEEFTTKRGVIPDIGCYNQLIIIYGKQGYLEQVENIYNYVTSSPDLSRQDLKIMKRTILNIYAKTGMVEKMDEWFKDHFSTAYDMDGTMKRLDKLILFSTLMKGYSKAEQPLKAIEIWNKVFQPNEDGLILCSPNDVVFSIYARVLLKVIELGLSDNPIETLNKLRKDIPRMREMAGLPKIDTILCNIILNALIIIFPNPTQWPVRVVPALESMMISGLVTGTTIDKMGKKLVINVAQQGVITGKLILWYVSNYHMDQNIDKIIIVTGKRYKGLHVKNDEKVSMRDSITQFLDTLSPECPIYTISKDGGRITIDKKNAKYLRYGVLSPHMNYD